MSGLAYPNDLASAILALGVGSDGHRFILRRCVEENRGHDTPCWVWTGAKCQGYGKVRGSGKPRRVHRATYELFVGEIPAGLHLDHLCRNRDYCNPGHLEAVTCKENIRRGELTYVLGERCRAGHILTPDSLKYRANGAGFCIICRRITDRKWQAASVKRPTRAAGWSNNVGQVAFASVGRACLMHLSVAAPAPARASCIGMAPAGTFTRVVHLDALGRAR